MISNPIIIIYVFGLLLEVMISLLKNKFLTAIPVIVSSIIFLITKEENWYDLAMLQTIMSFISITTCYVVQAISKKKRKSDVDKTKIKDLK